MVAQKNININFNCGETRSSPPEEYLCVSATRPQRTSTSISRLWKKHGGYTGLLTPCFLSGGLYWASFVALPDDSNRRGRIYESRATPDVLKTSAFTPRGHFSLNSRVTAKTIRRSAKIFFRIAQSECGGFSSARFYSLSRSSAHV